MVAWEHDRVESTGASSPAEGAEATSVDGLVDHLFRHSAGQMVAALARALGPGNLDLAEEVVQDALLRAMQTWPFHGVPENPRGWLIQVARNRAIDLLRREAASRRLLGTVGDAALEDWHLGRSVSSTAWLGDEQLEDDELRMILMCCHPDIPHEAQVALTLKIVGGFGVGEIARALLTREATVAQKLVRAKRLVRDQGLTLEMPDAADLALRLDSVLEVIYLMFNEGYTAHQGEELVRGELCGEAIRLASILSRHEHTDRPEVRALLALMLFQAARLASRCDRDGSVLLLEDQDRSRWDADMIRVGLRHFDRCADGERLSVYHLQAGIAACHVSAPSFAATDWEQILWLYDALMAVNPSPVVELNRAVAVAMVHGPEADLRAVSTVEADPALRDYYLLPATVAELWRRMGHPDEAERHYLRALDLQCSEPERRFLLGRLEACRRDGKDGAFAAR